MRSVSKPYLSNNQKTPELNRKGYPTTGGKCPRKDFREVEEKFQWLQKLIPHKISNEAKNQSIPMIIVLIVEFFKLQLHALSRKNDLLTDEVTRLQQIIAAGQYKGNNYKQLIQDTSSQHPLTQCLAFNSMPDYSNILQFKQMFSPVNFGSKQNLSDTSNIFYNSNTFLVHSLNV